MFLEYKVIGRNIRDARKQKNMTQEQVAEAIDISLQHYGKVERGDRHINLPRLAELSVLLNVPIEKLVEGSVLRTDAEFPQFQTATGNSDFLQAIQQLSKGCSESALRLMLRLCFSVADEDKTKDSH